MDLVAVGEEIEDVGVTEAEEEDAEDQEDLEAPKSSYNLIDYQECSLLEDLKTHLSQKISFQENQSTMKNVSALKSMVEKK